MVETLATDYTLIDSFRCTNSVRIARTDVRYRYAVLRLTRYAMKSADLLSSHTLLQTISTRAFISYESDVLLSVRLHVRSYLNAIIAKVPHVNNSHVLTSTNPCFNKAIQVLI